MELKKKENVRVQLAREVLSQLDSGRLIASGDYVQNSKLDNLSSDLKDFCISETDEALNLDARSFFEGEECKVCAKGALLIAAIDIFNSVTLKDFFNGPRPGVLSIDKDTKAKEWLSKFFDSDELALIEAVYEKSTWISKDVEELYNKDKESVTDALTFCTYYESRDFRLRKIMQNIIDNDGKFNPFDTSSTEK